MFLPFKGIESSLSLFAGLAIGLTTIFLIGKLKIPTAVWGVIPATASRYQVPLTIFLVTLFAVCPLTLNNYFIDVLIMAGIYAILAIGLNVIVGFTGLLNLGFAAFYACGAYTYALLNTKLGLGFWICLPISALFTSCVGFLLAVPALRLRGDYLAIVTLGFGEIMHLILNNWDSLTHGPNGITSIAPPTIADISLSDLSYFYYLVLVILLLSLLVIRRVELSRFGRAWKAIKENEIAASSVGINTMKYKLFAFAFGSFWAGIAGILFAAKMQFVSPESFTFIESVLILSMVILGGLGNTYGAVLGAVLLVLLPEVLREVQLYRMLVLGIGLVLLMRFRPQGLLGVR
ncbi:MAG: branched-chain amino acid ABC transporter permease [Dissulfurispiraceae bacterium]